MEIQTNGGIMGIKGYCNRHIGAGLLRHLQIARGPHASAFAQLLAQVREAFFLDVPMDGPVDEPAPLALAGDPVH